MNPSTAALLGVIAGVMLGALAMTLLGRHGREREQHLAASEPVLPEGVAEVLAVLRSIGIVLDQSDRVVTSSPAAVRHGLVRGEGLVHPELVEMARTVRRDGQIREVELELRRRPKSDASLIVFARIAQLAPEFVLLLIEDRSEARRVEEVRRDFVANVSHELKTPVGGIALLAEAVQDASDDPEAVARFARRMSDEADRLSRLVREIVDLSRLQGGEPLPEPTSVDIAACVREAVDRSRLLADGKGITIDVSVPASPVVWGDRELLTTAIRNLIGNAVTYSDPGSQVGVGLRVASGEVAIAVSDHGQGIGAAEQERIFERFYRVDSARSRHTGGTGLGLAIVKHIVENHGGQVSVWSEVGQGSTFTLWLPTAHEHEGDEAAPGERGTAAGTGAPAPEHAVSDPSPSPPRSTADESSDRTTLRKVSP